MNKSYGRERLEIEYIVTNKKYILRVHTSRDKIFA